MSTAVEVESLQLSDQAPLHAMTRSKCPKCGKMMGYFCFDCIVPMTGGVPQLELPVQVFIVQHGESNSKATGTQAALLSQQVTLLRHGDSSSHHRRQDPLSLQVPALDPEHTVILFPEGEDTPCVGAPGCPAFTHAVLLEGSWRKAKHVMLQHPALKALPRVKLAGDVRSIYWRRGAASFKGAVDSGVCTLECLYYLCRALRPGTCYDDLLWYFTVIRAKVQQHAAPMTAHYLAEAEAAQAEAKRRRLAEQQPPLELQGHTGAEQQHTDTASHGSGEVQPVPGEACRAGCGTAAAAGNASNVGGEGLQQRHPSSSKRAERMALEAQRLQLQRSLQQQKRLEGGGDAL